MNKKIGYWKWWYTRNEYELEMWFLLIDLIEFIILIVLIGFVTAGKFGIGVVMVGMIITCVLFLFVTWIHEKVKDSYDLYKHESKTMNK